MSDMPPSNRHHSQRENLGAEQPQEGIQCHEERKSRLSRSFPMLREAEVFPGVTNRVRQIPIPCGVLTPWAFLPVSFALPLNPSPTPDEIIVSSSVPVEGIRFFSAFPQGDAPGRNQRNSRRIPRFLVLPLSLLASQFVPCVQVQGTV